MDRGTVVRTDNRCPNYRAVGGYVETVGSENCSACGLSFTYGSGGSPGGGNECIRACNVGNTRKIRSPTMNETTGVPSPTTTAAEGGNCTNLLRNLDQRRKLMKVKD